MITLKSQEVKTHFSEILRKVESGQEFAITRHNKVIAKLISWHEPSSESKKEAVNDLLNFDKCRLAKGETIDDLRIESRR